MTGAVLALPGRQIQRARPGQVDDRSRLELDLRLRLVGEVQDVGLLDPCAGDQLVPGGAPQQPAAALEERHGADFGGRVGPDGEQRQGERQPGLPLFMDGFGAARRKPDSGARRLGEAPILGRASRGRQPKGIGPRAESGTLGENPEPILSFIDLSVFYVEGSQHLATALDQSRRLDALRPPGEFVGGAAPLELVDVAKQRRVGP